MANNTEQEDKPYPVGHESGRFYPLPANLEVATKRAHHLLDNLIESLHVGVDVGYSRDMLEEALGDIAVLR